MANLAAFCLLLTAVAAPDPVRIGVGIGVGIGCIVLGLSMIFQWGDWTFQGHALNKTAWQVIGVLLGLGGIGGGIAIAIA